MADPMGAIHSSFPSPVNSSDNTDYRADPEVTTERKGSFGGGFTNEYETGGVDRNGTDSYEENKDYVKRNSSRNYNLRRNSGDGY